MVSGVIANDHRRRNAAPGRIEIAAGLAIGGETIISEQGALPTPRKGCQQTESQRVFTDIWGVGGGVAVLPLKPAMLHCGLSRGEWLAYLSGGSLGAALVLCPLWLIFKKVRRNR
jgi:hypothetical protein